MATYYVDMAVGNDGNLGTSPGVGNAWKTLGKTQTAPIAAGDKVYVKGSADYTETLTISIVGTITAPVIFEGYTASPGDGGLATVNGSGVRATGMTPAAGNNYVVFKNFRFTNHTGVGCGNLTADQLTYKGCEFDNNGNDGVDADQSAMFEGCYAHDNGAVGFNVGGFTAFICCISIKNGTQGFHMEGGTCYKCIAFSNAGRNFDTSTTSYHVFIDCVSDGDGKDSDEGYRVTAAYPLSQVAMVNCVAYDCGVGVLSEAGLETERTISRNNLVNANTTPYSDFATHVGEVTSAPGFVSEATQDYTPDTGSPLIAAGFGPETNAWITQTGDASDIGAMDDVGGTCSYPAVGDVEAGVVYGGGTGTFAVPAAGDVELAVQYGAGGTEFTGTLVAGGGGGASTIRTGGQL